MGAGFAWSVVCLGHPEALLRASRTPADTKVPAPTSKTGAGDRAREPRKETVVPTIAESKPRRRSSERTLVGTPYACIPLWVLTADISPAARVLYAGLNSFVAGVSGSCFPTRKAISARTGLSVATIGRALRELKEIGAVRVEENYRERPGKGRERTANTYWLALDSPELRERFAGVPGSRPAADFAEASSAEGDLDDSPDASERGSSKVSRAVAEPSAVEAPAEPSRPVVEAREVSPGPLEVPPEPPQEPRKAPKEAAVSNPLFVEFKDVYGRVKPADGAAVEKAWLRVVQDRDPRAMRAKAEKLLEKTRDYVEGRMREKDPAARVKFTKSPVNFLSDGFWETVPPAPAQPEVGKVYFDEGPRVPLSEQEVYPSWKAAAEGDEGAIKAAKRRMRAGVTVPDAAVVQYPVLIDIFGLECDTYAPEEVRAVFRSLGKPVPGEETATGADEGDTVPADGGGSLFADLGASMRAGMGPAGLEADPADGMSTYDAGRFLT